MCLYIYVSVCTFVFPILGLFDQCILVGKPQLIPMMERKMTECGLEARLPGLNLSLAECQLRGHG